MLLCASEARPGACSQISALDQTMPSHTRPSRDALLVYVPLCHVVDQIISMLVSPNSLQDWCSDMHGLSEPLACINDVVLTVNTCADVARMHAGDAVRRVGNAAVACC